MRGVARLGDRTIGTCHCHSPSIRVGGTIVSCSTDSDNEPLGIARLGDLILADCGHYAKIITASDSFFVNGLGAARLGDLGGGDCYECTIITASDNLFTS